MVATRHDVFTVPVVVEGAPERVFSVFADPVLRRRLLRMPGSGASYEQDFRVGGTDVARSSFALPTGEQRLLNTAVYLEIDPPRRIVWSYSATVDDVTRWAALVTVELAPVLEGTSVSWTEQVAFLTESERPEDDPLHLRGAIRLRLNGLAALVASS